MLIGLLSGLLAAIIQPVAYLFSRIYLVRGGSAWSLTVYSQVIMGMISGAILLAFLPELPFSSQILKCSTCSVLTILVAQICYFFAVQTIEASRLSTMLGLKIIFLVLMNSAFLNQQINAWQWLAVLLSASSAFVMNHSGLRLNPRSAALVLCCCLFLATSDIADFNLVSAIPGTSPLRRGVLATAYCYGELGLLSLPLLLSRKLDKSKFLLALPYSLAWLSAMLVFFLCLGLLGTVFTCIIQSARGLISVLLGAAVAALGYAQVESKGTSRVWLGRLAAALMIMSAVLIFALARGQ